ncbi:MAG: aldo/keto reductase [Planctomycetota bacterium]
MNESIDPAMVPVRILTSGARMPAVGLGTFGSDHVSPQQVAEAVKGAIRLGYRHIDCASVYGNEKEVGAALREVIDEGTVTRDELWITSKLWNDMHNEGDVTKSCDQSLTDLGLEAVDMYLIHWPFPNYHAPGCDVSSRNENARPYINESYCRTWREMESLVEAGKAKHIGTSNMTVAKLKRFLPEASIKPSANELECHPHFQQTELFDFLTTEGIEPIGFSPIGSPGRPERDRTPEDTVDIEDPVIREIALAHNIHPACLCIKWSAQRGLTPIPFSTNPRNYRANLECVTTAPLTDEEMAAIATTDKGCRLIKGQVFLWKENQNWRDLWDEDGVIAE